MSGQAGYKVAILIGGTAVPVTEELCTNTSGDIYQVTDATRRCFDRDAAVSVYIDDVLIDPSLYHINYLYGVITVDASVDNGVMDISYSYVPLTEVAGANTFSLDFSGDILDKTNFKDANSQAGFRSKTYGLNDVTSSLEKIDIADTSFLDAKIARGAVMIEYDFDRTDTFTARGWFIIETDGFSGDVGSLINESISLNLEANDSASALKSFSFKPSL